MVKKRKQRERGGKWLIEVNTQNIVIVATQNNCNVLYCIVLQFIYSQKKCRNKSIAHTKRLRHVGVKASINDG